jgi:hypothetical protein
VDSINYEMIELLALPRYPICEANDFLNDPDQGTITIISRLEVMGNNVQSSGDLIVPSIFSGVVYSSWVTMARVEKL